MHFKIISLFIFTLTSVSAKSDTIAELYEIAVSIKECLTTKFPGVCLKERALESINESTHTPEPIMLGFIRIEKNDAYSWNHTIDEALPTEISKRSLKLGDVLYDKVMEFLKSRTIRLNVEDAVEGRKKGGGGGKGGGKGGVMKMVGAAVCMGAGMMMGKMGMMAMGAMMMSKLALLLSAIMVLKKMKGGGGDDEGGKEKQIKIIYATTSGGGGDYGKGGGGGGGGGWHRSLNPEPHTITYRAHVPQDANPNVVYEGTTVECKKEKDSQEPHSNCQ